jgi:hypothetical protein
MVRNVARDTERMHGSRLGLSLFHRPHVEEFRHVVRIVRGARIQRKGPPLPPMMTPTVRRQAEPLVYQPQYVFMLIAVIKIVGVTACLGIARFAMGGTDEDAGNVAAATLPCLGGQAIGASCFVVLIKDDDEEAVMAEVLSPAAAPINQRIDVGLEPLVRSAELGIGRRLANTRSARGGAIGTVAVVGVVATVRRDKGKVR